MSKKNKNKDTHNERERSRDNKNRKYKQSQDQEKESEQAQNKLSGKLINSFLDFFGKIKQEKGLVFTPQCRQKLKKEQQNLNLPKNDKLKINWTTTHQWHQNLERQKISQIINNQLLSLISQQQKLELIELFLNCSYIFAQETTNQLYLILCKIAIIVLKKQKDELNKLMKDIFENKDKNYIYFSFNFSKHFVVENKNQMPYNQLGLSIYNIIDLALNSKK